MTGGFLGAAFGGLTFGGDFFADGPASLSYPTQTQLLVEAELNGYSAGWTNITDDLTSAPIKIKRGFQSAAPDDLIASPAVAAFELNNAATNLHHTRGYYSPDSMSAPSGWNLQPRIRIRVIVNGAAQTRFIGWIQSITPKAGLYEEQTVSVTAASWLKLATDTLCTGVTVQTNQRADQLIALLDGVTVYPPPAISYATGLDTFPYALDDVDPRASYVIDALDSVIKSGIDRLYEQANGTLVFETRAFRAAGSTSARSLTDTAPAGSPGLAIKILPLSRSRDQLYSQLTVSVHPRSVDAAAVTLFSYVLSGSSPTVNSGSTITIDGPYQDPNQLAQRVGGINMLISDGAGGSTPGTSGSLPTSDWQITTGPNGTGSDVSAQCTITVTYEATKATFVVTNSSGSTGYISLLRCRGQGVYSYQQINARSTSASTSTLGKRNASIDCKYQALPSFAQAAADYLITVYGTQRSRLDQGVEFFVTSGDATSYATLLGLDISAAVGITETVTGLAGAFWVNAIEETYDEAMNLTIRFGLGPRTSGSGWQLGTVGQSELGQTTVLAGI